MSGSLSLPNEIILEIWSFVGAMSIPSLVRLSAVNRRTRSIWEKHSTPIVDQALQLGAPDYQDAIALTLLETRCPVPIKGFHSFDQSQEDPPIRLYLPQLLENIDLASTVSSELSSWEEQRGEGLPLACPPPPIYYLMRKLRAAYHYPQLRRPLCAAVADLLDEALHVWDSMSFWLYLDAPVDLSVANQIQDDSKRAMLDDGSLEPRALADDWEFVYDVGHQVGSDRRAGRSGHPDRDYLEWGGLKEPRPWSH